MSAGRVALPPPRPSLKVCVVVPARNEEALIGSCLRSLAEQEGISFAEFEVLLILDRCTDATEQRALEVADEYPDLYLYTLEGSGRGAGHARRVGMEEAHGRLMSLNRPDGLIASTDADTVVASNWLSVQLEAAAQGAKAIGGHIELRDNVDLPRAISGWREEQGRLRQDELLSVPGPNNEPRARTEHWRFSGASLALTAGTYQEIGGLEPRAALEDEYLERTLESRGVPIERPLAVRVATSARLVGRAKRGLARDLALASWVRNNTYDAHDFGPDELLNLKLSSETSVSAVIPTRGKGRGTAALLDALGPLLEAGLIDEMIVLRTEKGNDSPNFSTGARVKIYRDADLMPDFGPVRGYGDALWRGLSAAGGELLLFLDPSVPDPGGHRALGLLGPLLSRRALRFVKGFSAESNGEPATGTRSLDELSARPLINVYYPELAGFVEPLSPEFAARRALLSSLPFPAGYGVALSLLLDAANTAGMPALAQTQLHARPATDVPLPDLCEAAYAILVAATARAHGGENLDERAPGPLFLPLPIRAAGTTSFTQRRVAIEERPPLGSL